MMRRMLLVVASMLFVAFQSYAFAITVNGDLSDWGVNLQLTSVGGSYTKFVTASFTPVAPPLTVKYKVANDNPDCQGGEFCDVEAIYAMLDDTAQKAYFAVVTSSNPNGSTWDGYRTARFGPGDLKVWMKDGDVYGIGARPFDLRLHGIPVSDVNGNLDRRAPTWESFLDASWTSNAHPSPINPALHTLNARVEKNATWDHVDNTTLSPLDLHGPYYAYLVPDTGTDMGDAEAAWHQWSTSGDYYADDPNGREEPYGTWIYEVAVPYSCLGLPTEILDVRFFAVDCGNDIISINGYSGEVPPIPEASSLGLLGLGLLAIRRRRT